MERKESSRHLAAILFTDIVGYTTMMQRDEALALASVRKHHEILEEMIPAYEGEIYQYYGDGSLSIFSSAKQAVHCAFEIQKKMLADPPVLVRTGIHIGEIYTENGKIFGDGVNVASRIESMGQGGTVLFSKDVYEKIRNLPMFQVKSLGTFEFKNVDDPVSIYALTDSDIITPDGTLVEGKLKPEIKKSSRTLQVGLGVLVLAVLILGIFIAKGSGKSKVEDWETEKSVAVLPFKNYSEDKEEDFLSTGIAEDILTQLAQIKDLKVISQSSSIKYRDTDKDLMTIARELGVSSLLDGSVQRYENTLRVSVTLIKASDESIIWRESFDGQFEDILNVQRNVAMQVSEQLKITLTPEVKQRFEHRINVDPKAFVNYQKGEELLKHSSGSEENIDQARVYFEMAIKEDSTFTLAWVGLADAWIEALFWHRIADKDGLPQARQAAEKAMALDPGNGECYGVMGAVNIFERNLESAERNLTRSIELSPNYTRAYERLALIRIFQKREEEGFALYDKVIQLDPLTDRYKGSLGSVYYFLGRFEEGIYKMKEYLKQDPADNFILWSLAYNYAGNGEYEKAIETLKKRTQATNTNWVYTYCYAKLGRMDEAQKILDYHIERKKTDHIPDFMMSVQYISLGDTETGLDYLERSIDVQGENWFILGILNDPMLEPVRKLPRYHKMMMKFKRAYGL